MNYQVLAAAAGQCGLFDMKDTAQSHGELSLASKTAKGYACGNTSMSRKTSS